MPRRLLITTLAIAAVVAAPAAALQPVLTFKGTQCADAATEVPVADTARLAAQLPEGWRLRNSFYYRRPSLILNIAECAEMMADGRTRSAAGVAQVLTLVNPPEGESVAYILRDFSDHANYAEGSRRAGLAGGLAPALTSTLTRSASGTILGATASLPAGADSFDISVGGPAPLDAVLDADAAYVVGAMGPAGLAEMTLRYTGTELGVGGAVVRLPEGSYLAGLLGTTTIAGVGYAQNYTLDGMLRAASPLPPSGTTRFGTP